jgi:ribosome-binding factor A
MATSNRLQKIGDEVRRDLAMLLLTEAKDPRVKMVSITEVQVTRDLAHAKVYFTTLDQTPKHITEVQEALVHATGFLRSRLSEMSDLRITPKLNFVYDKSIEEGNRISAIIDKANKGL